MAIAMHETSRANHLQGQLQRATELLKSGRRRDAAELADGLTERYPESLDAWMLDCAAAQQLGRFDRMLSSASQALSLDPAHRGAQFRVLECQLYCGMADRVLDRLRSLEAGAGDDHLLLCKIAEFYTHCARHDSACRCYRRAVELRPNNAEYLFSLAASLIATGSIDEAELVLDRVIGLNPADFDAYRNRSTLRKQTAESNHIETMLQKLAEGPLRPAGEAQLCFALSKELEDVGRYDEAFALLKRGADRRRSQMRYRVESDLVAMERIAAVFDRSVFQRQAAGCPERGPIFVMGLPRSGTTLVDRILSSHSQVESLGEINDFAYALMRTAGGGDKLDLISRSAGIDAQLLGRRYIDSTRAYGRRAVRLIDKTPLNYLYVGLIHLALPRARIVHVRRNPMDSCYGMYRTLFRAGYPFSYDIDDLARYYIAYRRLMDHWRNVIPRAFLDVDYESIVADQERASRRIVDYCDLEWEPGCLDFHRNAAPVATASSAQVRQPVYADAVHRWRRYERQLQPLVTRLQAAGIDIGRQT